MTREQALDFIPLLSAYGAGKAIQVDRSDYGWTDIDEPHFDLPPERYRIKPQPHEFFAVMDNDQLLTYGFTHGRSKAELEREYGNQVVISREVMK